MENEDMENEDTSVGSEETEEETGQPDIKNLTKKIRFSQAQKACLAAYYTQGMTGIGKDNAALIFKAAEDTHLTVAQVKVSHKPR